MHLFLPNRSFSGIHRFFLYLLLLSLISAAIGWQIDSPSPKSWPTTGPWATWPSTRRRTNTYKTAEQERSERKSSSRRSRAPWSSMIHVLLSSAWWTKTLCRAGGKPDHIETNALVGGRVSFAGPSRVRHIPQVSSFFFQGRFRSTFRSATEVEHSGEPTGLLCRTVLLSPDYLFVIRGRVGSMSCTNVLLLAPDRPKRAVARVETGLLCRTV